MSVPFRFAWLSLATCCLIINWRKDILRLLLSDSFLIDSAYSGQNRNDVVFSRFLTTHSSTARSANSFQKKFSTRTSTTFVDENDNADETRVHGEVTFQRKIWLLLLVYIIPVSANGNTYGRGALSGATITETTADGSKVSQFQGAYWSRPYPPINRVGLIHNHDRPFARFGMKG